MKKNINLILALIIMGANYSTAHAVEKTDAINSENRTKPEYIAHLVSSLDDTANDDDYRRVAEEFCQRYNYSAEELYEHFQEIAGKHPLLSAKATKLHDAISFLIATKQQADIAIKALELQKEDDRQLDAAIDESMKEKPIVAEKAKASEEKRSEIEKISLAQSERMVDEIDQQTDQQLATNLQQKENKRALAPKQEESKTEPTAKHDNLMDARNHLRSAPQKPKNTHSNTEDNSNNNPFAVPLKSVPKVATEEEKNEQPLFGNTLSKNPVKQPSKEDLEKQLNQAEDELEQAIENRASSQVVNTLKEKISELKKQIARLDR